MVDWSKKFRPEYLYARGWLQKPENFLPEWQPLVKRLHSLLGESGFGAGDAAAFAELRTCLAKTKDSKTASEARAVLEAANAWSNNPASAIEDKALMRAAALKLLRHVYILSSSGNRTAWVVSLPQEFRDWPSDDLNARATTQAMARTLLAADNEIFSEEQKKHLGSATFHALAWAQKATSLLAAAMTAACGKGSTSDETSLQVVKRWFADPAVTDIELKAYANTLHMGQEDRRDVEQGPVRVDGLGPPAHCECRGRVVLP